LGADSRLESPLDHFPSDKIKQNLYLWFLFSPGQCMKRSLLSSIFHQFS
jgi:hypothetical protein